MSDGRLPRLIEPSKLAQQGLILEGFVLAKDLPRVQAAVLGIERVECGLRYSVDEQYRRLVSGTLKTAVELSCQRCLEPVARDIEVDVNVALVRKEAQAKELPAWLDPWIVESAEADFYEFVEEELLLNIPQIAWHDENCIDSALYSSGEVAEVVQEKGENPFKVLETLKQKD